MMLTPEKGGCPLVDLPAKSVVLMDEWRFDSPVVSTATQLLWYEGKPFTVSQPQTDGRVGHILYQGTAPIFITTKAQYLESLMKEAAAAQAADESSVSASSVASVWVSSGKVLTAQCF